MPRTFPPKTREVPEGYCKNGQGSSEIMSCWQAFIMYPSIADQATTEDSLENDALSTSPQNKGQVFPTPPESAKLGVVSSLGG